jgi:hypothetical protein
MQERKNIILRLERDIATQLKIYCAENNITQQDLIKGLVVKELKKAAKKKAAADE